MITTPAFPESVIESPSAPVRTFFIRATVVAASGALCVAELNGFRIFDESLRGSHAAATAIPSPMEFLALVGAISSGIVAGIVCALTCVGWLIRRLHHANDESFGIDAACMGDECAAHNISCHT